MVLLNKGCFRVVLFTIQKQRLGSTKNIKRRRALIKFHIGFKLLLLLLIDRIELVKTLYSVKIFFTLSK
jgi:hypothetical protein